MDRYEDYLPDEFLGSKDTDEIVEDYIDLKRYQEHEDESMLFWCIVNVQVLLSIDYCNVLNGVQ